MSTLVSSTLVRRRKSIPRQFLASGIGPDLGQGSNFEMERSVDIVDQLRTEASEVAGERNLDVLERAQRGLVHRKFRDLNARRVMPQTEEEVRYTAHLREYIRLKLYAHRLKVQVSREWAPLPSASYEGSIANLLAKAAAHRKVMSQIEAGCESYFVQFWL